MTTQPLPERPNLEQLKHQAKSLLHSAQRKDSAALERFRALPAFSPKSDDELARLTFALHDAQSVIAREHGFASWNSLRERVEELTLELAGAVQQFVEAAVDGRTDRAERLLGLYPRIADASFHTALVLGDAVAIESRLKQRPNLAKEKGGPRGWEPLLYVCHSTLHRNRPTRADGLVAIARQLLQLGADPNTRFPWLHHGVRRPALWGAACVTRVLPLVDLLIEFGAQPNDGVTLTIAASGPDVPLLERLVAQGADVNFPWATDGASPLYAILNWVREPDGPLWLLAHGANPNAIFRANGETPLHVVARKGEVVVAEQLVKRGALIDARRADGRTPYAVASLSGNRRVADWLLAHGASPALSEIDRFVAACSRGDRTAASALLANRPDLRSELGAEHHAVLRAAAERNDVKALEAMLECGFDPNVPDDEIGKTALHCAAMEGWPDAVRVLLAHGASVSVRDREFHGQPLIWAAEGSRHVHGAGRDHAAVGRLLIAAGSPTDWQPGEEPAEPLIEILDEWRRDFGTVHDKRGSRSPSSL